MVDGPDPYAARFRRLRALWRWAAPVRLVVFALTILGAVAAATLGPALVVPQLVLITGVAATADAIIGRVAWGRWRMPWTGTASGLFVALLFPPQGAPGLASSNALLALGAGLALLGILTKHLVRIRDRPLVNPAAFAIALGTVLFGIAPAWLGGISLWAVLAAGIVVTARTWRRADLPLLFFALYAGAAVLHLVLSQGITDVRVVALAVVDPSVLFFTLFMVVEPRTAPSDTSGRRLYAVIVATTAALLGFGLPTLPYLASIALLAALLTGNVVAGVLRLAPAPAAEAAGAARPTRRPTARPRPIDPRSGWVGRSVLGLALLVVLGGLAILAGPPGPAAAGPPPITASGCVLDNRSIPTAQLDALHSRLGPSVILEYDPATASTVFYDPSNHVTVFETDLYEDYGFAEFNGDDQIIAQGCGGSGSAAG